MLVFSRPQQGISAASSSPIVCARSRSVSIREPARAGRCESRKLLCHASGNSEPPASAPRFAGGNELAWSRAREKPSAEVKQADGGVPEGLQAGPSLHDLWQDDTSASAEPDPQRMRVAAAARARAAAADQELQRKLTGRLAQSSTDDGRAFMDALTSATPMAMPTDTQRRQSRRTEAEEIRADRQARMQQQGLEGEAAGSRWRAADRSDGAAATWPRRGARGAAELQEMLSSLDTSDGDSGTDGSMSAEQFTLQKAQAVRDQGVDVISRDKDYKPAVNTWGVFDRPANISEAYGGGRNLTPEDSVMSAAEQQQYDAQLRRKLARFRKDAGLMVDPAAQARCEQLTEQGSVLLDSGRLDGALVLFTEAAALLPVKSNAGGAAALQKAITLDSLGRHDDALTLYNQLRTHRVTAIAKQARSMSFGFDAGKFLKAETMSYAATKEEYDPFFSVLRGKWGWDTVYVATEEEKAAAAAANRAALAAAAALVAAPLGWVYWVATV